VILMSLTPKVYTRMYSRKNLSRGGDPILSLAVPLRLQKANVFGSEQEFVRALDLRGTKGEHFR
jgi:hypothetical protein